VQLAARHVESHERVRPLARSSFVRRAGVRVYDQRPPRVLGEVEAVDARRGQFSSLRILALDR
jgi:hypothetical protein